MAAWRDLSLPEDTPAEVRRLAPLEDAAGVAAADDGSADLAAGLAEMGLTPRAAWYIGAALYGGGGLLVTGLYMIDPALVPRGVFGLGYFAMVIGVLAFLGGRFVGSNSVLAWTAHARLIAGLVIYVIAAIILRDKLVAYALLPLLTVPTPCYLYAWRSALPYVAAAASIVFVGLLNVGGPARVAHALITTFAVIVIAAAILVTKERGRRLASRNRKLAYTDPLTGIANMRCLRERISTEMGHTRGVGSPFALFAIDLDDFKRVNDRFDHSLGDRVLCAVAKALNEELEPGDLAARRGGDEFSVLAPNRPARDLDALRERLVGAIARARIATCPQVTPSGTAAYVRTRPGEELGSMMERADQALNDAKGASRKRRRLASEKDTIYANNARPIADAVVHFERFAGNTQTEQAGTARRSERVRTERTGRSDPDWRLAAILIALAGLATAVTPVALMVKPLTTLEGTLIAAALVGLSLGCVWAGVSGVSRNWLHLPWAAAYGLVALVILFAGPSGTALLDLLPVFVLYGFLLFTARTAAFYLLVGQGLYGAFALSGSFGQGVARTVITTVIIAVVCGVVAKLRLVTIRFARTNRELSELDALTGVGNVRALHGRIADVAERASSQQLHPALVAIDLDEFKQVNDVHSHSTGDLVLIAVARAVSECVRVDELVARRGGDEFVVVLNDADSQYTDAVERRIQEAIIKARRRICQDLRPTASVTSVSWRPGKRPEELLREIDIALHGKKVESRHAPIPTGIANGSRRDYKAPSDELSAQNAGVAH